MNLSFKLLLETGYNQYWQILYPSYLVIMTVCSFFLSAKSFGKILEIQKLGINDNFSLFEKITLGFLIGLMLCFSFTNIYFFVVIIRFELYGGDTLEIMEWQKKINYASSKVTSAMMQGMFIT